MMKRLNCVFFLMIEKFEYFLEKTRKMNPILGVIL
jgi:hypothetical protein